MKEGTNSNRSVIFGVIFLLVGASGTPALCLAEITLENQMNSQACESYDHDDSLNLRDRLFLQESFHYGYRKRSVRISMRRDIKPSQPMMALGNPPGEEWNKTYAYGDWVSHVAMWNQGYCVRQTSDGGYIITGSTWGNYEVGYSGRDVLLIKTDAAGEEEWNRTFGGDGLHDLEMGWSVVEATDGGYVLIGDATFNYEDVVWMIKTDADGNELWNRTHGKGAMFGAWGNDIEKTVDGGYIITGWFDGYVWLLKTNADGFKEWSTYFHDDGLGLGGFSVQQTTDGGYVIGGEYGRDYPEVSCWDTDAWLIKTDANGNKQWDMLFGLPQHCHHEVEPTVQQTADGGYILSYSKYWRDHTALDICFVKIDANGIEEWNKTFGGSGDDYCASVHQTNDDGYILAGSTRSYGAGNSDAWLIKTYPNGNIEWDVTFGDELENRVFSMQLTEQGGYILVGESFVKSENTSYPDSKVWLVKVAPDPDPIFQKGVLFGKITNLIDTKDGLLAFNTIEVRFLIFSPLSFGHFSPSKGVAVSQDYVGLVTEKRICGVFEVVVS